jgi:alpha-D-xyloside xylohydrolase
MCHDAVQQRHSFMQPMWVSFAEDPNCQALDDQWMAGSDVLVAPFLSEEGGRRVYLPAGEWFDLRCGKTLSGERWTQSSRTPHLPCFARTQSAFMNLFRQAPDILRGTAK